MSERDTAAASANTKRAAVAAVDSGAAAATPAPAVRAPLLPGLPADGWAVTRHGDVAWNDHTRVVLDSVGGAAGIAQVTARFYAKFEADAHLRQFLGGLQTALPTHAHRLASYIAEMMGDPARPWSRDTRSRPKVAQRLAHGRTTVVTDRFGAHHAAWHSVDRPADAVGRRFKLDDCRVWMRLLFWAARDAGHAPETSLFFRYLLRFVGHFIAIYENTARPFVRLEARWAAEAANTDAYAAGALARPAAAGDPCAGAPPPGTPRFMADVVGVPLAVAAASLPASERAGTDEWLYGDAPVVDA